MRDRPTGLTVGGERAVTSSAEGVARTAEGVVVVVAIWTREHAHIFIEEFTLRQFAGKTVDLARPITRFAGSIAGWRFERTHLPRQREPPL